MFTVKSTNHYRGNEYSNEFDTEEEALEFADNEASEGIYATVYDANGTEIASFEPEYEDDGGEEYCGYDVDAAGNCYSDADPGM